MAPAAGFRSRNVSIALSFRFISVLNALQKRFKRIVINLNCVLHAYEVERSFDKF